MSFLKYVMSLAVVMALMACGGGGGAPGLPSGTSSPLITTAQSAVTMVVGSSSEYAISGGRAPYTVSSSNSSIVTAGMSDNAFKITAIVFGTATVQIKDAIGGIVSVAVTVSDGSSPTSLYTTAPSALTIAVGTTQAYTISGGLTPYTANSSNSAVAVAGVAVNKISISAVSVGTATIGILDAAGKSISVSVTVSNGSSALPLYTTAPSSVTISNGGARAYVIGGGLAPYTATSSDAAVASADVVGSTLSVVGLTGGLASITIRDAAGTTLSFGVKVGSATNFFTTAPTALTLQADSSSSFIVSGGSQNYAASSSNTEVASAVVSGTTLIITGHALGTASVMVLDSTGSSILISVTVLSSATSRVSSIDVTTSTNTLQSAGSEALITALVKNSGNVGVAGQTVVFSSSSGTLQSPSAVTDASGAATVKLSAGSDKSIRDIRVTATVGSISGSVIVPVTGTRIAITGSGSLQAGGAAEQYTVRAIDSSSNPIPGASIAVRSALGNAVSPASFTTDSTGSATFLYTPSLAGLDTLTASGLGASATAAVSVSAINFIVLSPASNTAIDIGTAQTITVKYLLSGVGVAGKTVTFSTTRGVFSVSSATTDAGGLASATLSSTTAGYAVVTAQIAGVGSVSVPVQFVATTPASITVQSNPGAIQPNTTGTTNQSTIEAVVRDAAGNPVANRQVNFTIVQDLSNGALSTGNALTDANGRAQIQFISGASSTPANGVIIKAEVASTAISSTTSLTVNGNALFITIGFGNEIGNLDPTTYSKAFTVYVTDSNGVAVGNKLVTLSVIPKNYYKGTLSRGLEFWSYSAGSPTVCVNEDLNSDGILNAGEDTNGNGQLTPGNIAVAAPGSVTTDATGHATFNLQYGEQFAPWALVTIAARASVAGTESRQSILFDLIGLLSDFEAGTVPAGVVSPFGSSASCTDAL